MDIASVIILFLATALSAVHSCCHPVAASLASCKNTSWNDDNNNNNSFFFNKNFIEK